MARRGLVSKSAGGPQSGGNAALMPKGEKPKGPDLIPLVEVARRLRVDVSQVESWVQKDQLRGNEAGVRPYDFKKFQLDYPEEVKRAQKEAVQDKQTKADRKPKKSGGIWNKFGSLLGFGGKDDDSAASSKLAKENQNLKRELEKLKKSKPSKDSGPNELEEKVRYLEGKLSETRALEAEVLQLKKQLKTSGNGVPADSESSGKIQTLKAELESTRSRMAELEQQSAEASQLRGALQDAHRHQEELEARLEQAEQSSQGSGTDEAEVHQLRQTLETLEGNLLDLQRHLSSIQQENQRLRQEMEESTQAPAASGDDNQTALIEELLDLQRVNLERFRRLSALYQESQSQLQAAGPSSDDAELAELKKRYDELVAQQQQTGTDSAGSELMEQLSAARLTVNKLKEENANLRAQLEEGQSNEAEERVKELEAQIQELKAQGGSQKLMETELSNLRKSMHAKESQVQKVAGRLAENEKRLAKAMQESARLTELLIERENRLRELSNEFEQEYRDKMENLDRQVSGLQWKLSLREERIASLEAELAKKSH